MRTGLTLMLLIGCAPTEPWPLDKAGRVEGTANVTAGLTGDVWSFLYAPGEGPPGPPAFPRFATAVSSLRLTSGDARFVFGSVAPNPYRLWGFLDVDSNFDPQVDVLAQPGAGDRTSDGLEVNLQPGATLKQDLDVRTAVADEPPGFRLEGDETDVVLDGALDNPKVLTVVSDGAGHLDPKRTAFHVGLLDTNGDQMPDDLDGNMIPDLSLQLFLRWRPRPGEDNGGGSIVVPLALDPSPFLAALGGRLDVEVAVTRLQGTVIAQAQRLITEPGKLPQVTPVGSPPTGAYELIALAPTGQFWRIPNDLAAEQPPQGVRFHFDRAGP